MRSISTFPSPLYFTKALNPPPSMSDIISSLGLSNSFAASTTKSNFIVSLADGTLHSDQFNTWLYQDYIYVRLFVPFALGVATKIPDDEPAYKPLKDLILSNDFQVLKDELHLFRKRAAGNGIILPVLPEVKDTVEEELKFYGDLKLLEELQRHFSHVYNEVSSYNIAYIKFLLQTTADPRVSWRYLIPLFWIIEKSYRDSFAFVINSEKFTQTADNNMKEFVSWWGNNSNFDQFVALLEKSTTQLIDDDEKNKALVLDAVKNVLAYEKNFFDGTFGLK